MSQLISVAANTNTYIQFDTKIPSLSDTSDIVEAFRLYHYGLDNYTTNTAPAANSIHSHLTTMKTDISDLQSNQAAINPLLLMGA